MHVLSTVPSVTATEQLTVQPLSDLAGAQKLRVNVWSLAAGEWSWGRHVHSEQEEFYLVLDGRLRVEAGGDTFELGPREALFVPAGVPHQLWNAGETEATYLAAAAPAAQGDSAPA